MPDVRTMGGPPAMKAGAVRRGVVKPGVSLGQHMGVDRATVQPRAPESPQPRPASRQQQRPPRRRKPPTPGPGSYTSVTKGREALGRHGNGGPRFSFGTSSRFADASPQFISKGHAQAAAAPDRSPGPTAYDTREGPGLHERARWEPNAFSFGRPGSARRAARRGQQSSTPGPGNYDLRGAAASGPAFSLRRPASALGRNERRPGPADRDRSSEHKPTGASYSFGRAAQRAGSGSSARRPKSAPARRRKHAPVKPPIIADTEADATPALGPNSGSPAFSLGLPATDQSQGSRFLSKDHCRSKVGRQSPPPQLGHGAGANLVVTPAPSGHSFGRAERLPFEE